MHKSMLQTRSTTWSMTMNKDEYMERYARLAQQSEELRRRLSISSPLNDDLSPTQSMSPTCSPNRRRSSVSSPFTFPAAQAWPIPHAVPDTWRASESEQVDEANLFEVNNKIKALLTDLLNCEEVKTDKMYRAWVQARLMDAEHEIRRQRRRRSSAAQETMRAISLSQGLAEIPGCRSSF